MPSLASRLLKRGLLDRTVDLVSGVIYGELVLTAVTDPLTTTRSQLVLPTGGTYARQTLLNSGDPRTFTNLSAGVFWTFASPVWNSLTYSESSSTVKGMAIIKQAGGSPAGTDSFLLYTELNSPYLANGANLSLVLPSNGVLEIP